MSKGFYHHFFGTIYRTNLTDFSMLFSPPSLHNVEMQKLEYFLFPSAVYFERIFRLPIFVPAILKGLTGFLNFGVVSFSSCVTFRYTSISEWRHFSKGVNFEIDTSLSSKPCHFFMEQYMKKINVLSCLLSEEFSPFST